MSPLIRHIIHLSGLWINQMESGDWKSIILGLFWEQNQWEENRIPVWQANKGKEILAIAKHKFIFEGWVVAHQSNNDPTALLNNWVDSLTCLALAKMEEKLDEDKCSSLIEWPQIKWGCSGVKDLFTEVGSDQRALQWPYFHLYSVPYLLDSSPGLNLTHFTQQVGCLWSGTTAQLAGISFQAMENWWQKVDDGELFFIIFYNFFFSCTFHACLLVSHPGTRPGGRI